MKKIVLLLLVIGPMAACFAQKPASYIKRSSLGLNFVLKDMNTAVLIDKTSLSEVLSNGQWTSINDMVPGLSLTYMNGLTDKIDFMSNLGGSFLKYPFSYTSGKATPTESKFLLELDANANFKLLSDKHIVVPYLSFGVGASMYNSTYFAAYAPMGLGLQVSLGEGTYLSSRFVYNAMVSSLSVNHFNYTIGVLSPLKEKKELVAPPPPPPPMPAAEVDSDNDGIADTRDKCPAVGGATRYGGCPVPDSDSDGINDDNDKCPAVKGLFRYDGCPVPDKDRDGMTDDEDKCPDVAGVARYQGCPVPDKDGDGINDEEDRCPDVRGVRENNGCPLAVKAEVLTRVNTNARNLFFQTNSDKLLPRSFKALDDVVAVLNEDQALKLDIEGHTDITGSDAINTPLSKNRARAVYTYIVSKGIAESRLSSEGYGSTQPKADNKTAQGRAENRRVEMKLRYN
jgi:OOP family OmpA-OmpF porin